MDLEEWTLKVEVEKLPWSACFYALVSLMLHESS